MLTKIEGTSKQNKANKLTLNWKGPYLVKDEVRQGTFRLMDQDGKYYLTLGMPTT